MPMHDMTRTVGDHPTDQTRVMEVLEASSRPRSAAEIAVADPSLARNRLQLLVALDELVGSDRISKRFDPSSQAWRYSLARPYRRATGRAS